MLDKKTFKCSRCGECCKKLTILLNNEDIKRIEAAGFSDFYEKENIGPYKGKYVLKRKDECVFLVDGNNCKIYDIRPLICKKYPFFGRIVESCKPISILKRL